MKWRKPLNPYSSVHLALKSPPIWLKQLLARFIVIAKTIFCFKKCQNQKPGQGQLQCQNIYARCSIEFGPFFPITGDGFISVFSFVRNQQIGNFLAKLVAVIQVLFILLLPLSNYSFSSFSSPTDSDKTFNAEGTLLHITAIKKTIELISSYFLAYSSLQNFREYMLRLKNWWFSVVSFKSLCSWLLHIFGQSVSYSGLYVERIFDLVQ